MKICNTQKKNLRHVVNNSAILPRCIQENVQVSHGSNNVSQVKIASCRTRDIV